MPCACAWCLCLCLCPCLHPSVSMPQRLPGRAGDRCSPGLRSLPARALRYHVLLIIRALESTAALPHSTAARASQCLTLLVYAGTRTSRHVGNA